MDEIPTAPSPSPVPGSSSGASSGAGGSGGYDASGGANSSSGNAPAFTFENASVDATPGQDGRIGNLEQKAFGYAYPDRDAASRLEHLERETFGKISKTPVEARITALENKLLGSSFGAGSSGRQGGNPAGSQPNQQTSFQSGGMAPQAGMPSFQNDNQYPGPAAIPVNNQQSYQTQQPSYQSQPPPQQQAPPPSPVPQRGQQRPPARPPQAPPARQAQPVRAASTGMGSSMPPGMSSSLSPGMPSALAIAPQAVAAALPYDASAGDYLAAVRKFPTSQGGQTYAHWQNFPVKIKVPGGSPESWQRAVEAVIARWGQYVPVKMALPRENCDAEIVWVNELPKGLLGVTRFSVKNGQLHSWIYLLRPSFYPAQVSERNLSPVFLREMGHVLGLWGRSDKPGDLMYQGEAGKGKPGVAANISGRDINTLKRIYESPALPPDFSLDEPIEWASGY